MNKLTEKKKNSKKQNTGKKQKKPTKKQIAQKKAFLRTEAAAIIAAFLGIFLFLSVVGALGTVGELAGGFMKGIFGVMAYIFPFFLLYLAFFCVTRRNDALFGWKVAAICILFFTAAGMIQLIAGTKESLPLPEIYRNAKDGLFLHEGSGGFFGAMLSQGIGSVLGRAGAWLILIVLMLIALVAITEKSIISFTRRGLEKTAAAAKTEGQRARVRLSEEHVRSEARREARQLRRKEEMLEKAVAEENARHERKPASLTSFDLRKDQREEMKEYAEEIENSYVSIAEEPETVSVPEPEENKGILPQRMSQEPDYESDEVPFEETGEDRYKAYGKMLANGSLGIREAEAMGYAVKREWTTEAAAAVTEEKTQEYLDDSYEETEEEDHLHKALSPEEIIYPEVGTIGPVPEEAEAVFGTDEPVITEESVIMEEPVFIGEPADAFLTETPGEPEITPEPDISEEPDPEFIEAEFRRRHIEERTPIHVSMDPCAEEETKGFGAEKAVSPEKAQKSTEDAQAELDKKREEQKKARKVPPRPYRFPPVELLSRGKKPQSGESDEIQRNSRKLEEVLGSFGVGVRVTNVVVGPRVTRYELAPDIGVKLSRITSLAGDIKLALAATELRLEAPIPGKSAVGIEIPNKVSQMVTFRDIMETEPFRNAKQKLAWGVGLDIQGLPVIGDIAKMPHLLVSGTTGSGKSVGINSIIMSVIYRQKPEDVKMILVDPKVVELSVYDGIPHLLAPVVTKPEQAINVLKQAVAEMNQRYRLFKESNTRNIKGYNEKVEEACRRLPEGTEKPEKMPYILIIIDELAELMMHSKKDVEEAIASLTQLARAAGIHLVVATQRPSVDVVTGLIKSNIPSRVAMRLPSLIDSRTILDQGGAENLLGNGDMLYKTGDMGSPIRIQGCYLSDEEVQNVVEWLKRNNAGGYSDEWETAMNAVPAPKGDAGGAGFDSAPNKEDGLDEYFYEAGELIVDKKKASIGMLQRKFKIGFNRAARIMEQLCEKGVVSEGEGTKERMILMTPEEFRERF